MSTTVEVFGREEIVAKFQAIPAKSRGSILRALLRLSIAGQRGVRWNLSGAVLHVRTGALRSSAMHGVEDRGDELLGFFGIPKGPTAVYGRAHEYGFDGVVTVRAHLRETAGKRRSVRRFVFADSELAAFESGSTVVRPHSRHQHTPERSFVRTALAALQPMVREEMTGAVREAVS